MTEAQIRARKAIGEAASEWVVLLAGPAATAADKSAFMEWLRQSPFHVQEYLRAEVAFLELQGAAGGDATAVDELLAQAPRNVVDLGTVGLNGPPISAPSSAASASATASAKASAAPFATASAVASAVTAATDDATFGVPRIRNRQPLPRRRRPLLVAAAVAALAIAAAFAPALIDTLRTDTYTTSTGEQRRVVLSDGSTIDLNTQTRVRVRFTDAARDIELTGGEAYFTVAKDSARPFAVTASNRQVRALGTAFIVRDDRRQLTVTLIEGKVTVGPVGAAHGTTREPSGARSGEPAAPLALVPGQRVTFAATGEDARLDSPAIEKVTAWRERRLIVDNQTVAEVATEFNRYNTRQIVIDDARLADERINGVFDADKPQSLLDFLVRNTSAHIEERAGRLIVTKAAASPLVDDNGR